MDSDHSNFVEQGRLTRRHGHPSGSPPRAVCVSRMCVGGRCRVDVGRRGRSDFARASHRSGGADGPRRGPGEDGPAAAAALWRRELREHFGYEGPLSGVVPIVATGSLQVVAVTPLRSYDLAMLDRLRRGAPLSGIPIQRDVVVMVVPVPASAVAVRAVALTVNGRTVAETRSDLKVGQPGLVGFPLREFSTGTTLVFTVSLIRGDPFVRAVGPHELMRLR